MTRDDLAPEIIFMVGLPGAGKTSWVATHLHHYSVIDPDIIMQSHPDYDPRHPGEFYRWAKQRSESMLNHALRNETGRWVYVGTGANIVTLLGRFAMAKRHNFRIGLIYVYCSLETALERNALRERRIPDSVICEKARHIEANYLRARSFVDFSQQVDTNNAPPPLVVSPSLAERLPFAASAALSSRSHMTA
jgi:predicted kinase